MANPEAEAVADRAIRRSTAAPSGSASASSRRASRSSRRRATAARRRHGQLLRVGVARSAACPVVDRPPARAVSPLSRPPSTSRSTFWPPSQIDLAQRFSSRDEDKFAGVDWSPGLGGAPLLAGALAHLECRREAAYEGGDHLILIGRVLRTRRRRPRRCCLPKGATASPRTTPIFGAWRQPDEGSGLPAERAVSHADVPGLPGHRRQLRGASRRGRRHRGQARTLTACQRAQD